MHGAGSIRVGIGGWNFAPWRNNFYPDRLPQSEELAYAAQRLGSIEINATFYGSQKPASFVKWRQATPADFMFAVKAPRFATNRRVLAEARDSIERFFGSGVLELRDKLGPVNWQFPPTKKFDAGDFAAFLQLLPRERGMRLRHALEVRHESFRDPEFAALAREFGAAIVLAGDAEYVEINEVTADFRYVRLMGTMAGEPLGYAEAALNDWAGRLKQMAAGGQELFVYVISGAKERNPAAAMGLQKELFFL